MPFTKEDDCDRSTVQNKDDGCVLGKLVWAINWSLVALRWSLTMQEDFDTKTHFHGERKHRKMILYGQKYLDTPVNRWIWVFCTEPLRQVCKMKQLDMQSAFTNVCERMGSSAEISQFKNNTVIGCHLGDRSVCVISTMLDTSRSTVSSRIEKWKCLRTTET